MDQDHDVALEIVMDIWQRAELFLAGLLRQWNLYQIGIALALWLIAWLLARLVRPRYHDWLRAREGWPKWRLRFGLQLHRRMVLILFVLLAWPVVWVMQQVTWPSRSHLLEIIATLAFAWLAIALITRFIANDIVRKLVRIGAWIWVTLSIVGLTSETRQLLDSFAFSLGETRFSLWLMIQAAVVLTALFTIARFVSHAGAANIHRSEDLSPSMQVLAVKFLQVVLYGIAFFVALRIVGLDLTGLTLFSGAVGVGLGFGLQKVVSNLVSGIIILLDKSVKPGDVISIGDTFGWINTLGARYVSITTRDGKEYLIPNEDLITGQVVNWSHSNDFVRVDIEFGTAYSDDPHLVRRVATKAALTVNRVLNAQPPVCHITGFGDSSVDYILRFWIVDPSQGLTNVRGEVFLALWDAFAAEGISIPFPQREVRHLNGPGTDQAETT